MKIKKSFGQKTFYVALNLLALTLFFPDKTFLQQNRGVRLRAIVIPYAVTTVQRKTFAVSVALRVHTSC